MQVQLAPDVVYDPNTKGYIMLQLPELTVNPLEFEGIQLTPKRTFHCSLVAARKLAAGRAGIEERIVDIVRRQLAIEPVKFSGLTGQVYVCRKPNDAGEMQTAVIAMADILGLDGLRHALYQENQDFTVSLPHVTLLKSGNSPYGIGVNFEADLAAYCERHDELLVRIYQ